MTDRIPRNEYPRPQARRDEWTCLNGEWEFEIDQGDSGLERGLLERPLASTIVVPFSPEAPLSGIGNTDFLNAVWYRRTIDVPWDRALLHFQAVDYDATVWVDGVEAARHRGGSTPFSVLLQRGTRTVVVRARDDNSPKPRGKQSDRLEPYNCLYPRTTGIWQTVWMEPVPDTYLLRPRLTPDVAASTIRLEQGVTGPARGLVVHAAVSDADGLVCVAEREAGFGCAVDLAIPAGRRRLWSIEDPHLYDVTIELRDGDRVVDRLESYAGLRSLGIDGPALMLNGRPVFQRLVLDQGYWPDGVLTSPSDEELEADIRRAQAAGFNGARMHEKIAEERWLYHADRLGYLVWGEFGDWGGAGQGPTTQRPRPGVTYVAQWLEAIERDYSHPCIVGWCGLNETRRPIGDHVADMDDLTLAMFLAAKSADRTRPVLDTSGFTHRVAETDVYDAHDYDQDPASFKARWEAAEKVAWTPEGSVGVEWRGQPCFISEFGGTWWNPDDPDGWGYGSRPASVEEFYERFAGLCGALIDNPTIAGYCYTQLTDVYQEQNGLYTFDRRPKFDIDRLRSVQEREAAIEKLG